MKRLSLWAWLCGMALTISGILALWMVSPPSRAATHCALIDASFSSGVRQTTAGQWPILTDLKLESTINAVGIPAGVFVHSKAIGGGGPAEFRQQWEEVQEQAALPGSAPLTCIILGISGGVVGDLYGVMTDTLALAAEIRATGLRVIMLGYPPVARLGQHWLDAVAIPGLAKQGLTLADYEAARRWYEDQVRLAADCYVNPWRLLIPIADGLHPNWQSAYWAAITIVDAILYQRVYLP